jgi:hypothetical protein
MKPIPLRRLLALLLALSLTACGGGKATFTINGTVTGQEYPGLVLTTNGQDLAVNPAANPNANTTVSFTFPKPIEYGDAYALSIKTQPAHQTCSALDLYDNDTAGRFASINIPVTCSLQAHTIGGAAGSVTGLTADGLVLINGTNGGTLTLTTANAAAGFTFASAVVFGTTYGVTVLTNPPGLNCSVANGAGTMGDDNVTNITVNCVPAS